MTFLIETTKLIKLITQLVLLHHTFYTKKPISLTKMTQLKLFPKRKQSLPHKTNHRTSSTLHSSPVPDPTLSNYSNVSTTRIDYLVDTTPVINEYDSTVNAYSERNYPFPSPSF